MSDNANHHALQFLNTQLYVLETYMRAMGYTFAADKLGEIRGDIMTYYKEVFESEANGKKEIGKDSKSIRSKKS